jgi:flavin reductase (DIM6/NTAB) family NADH-FMN oxidoreductase RutF
VPTFVVVPQRRDGRGGRVGCGEHVASSADFTFGHPAMPTIGHARMVSMVGSNPFIPNEAERDPNRRFRGRLASPVSIFTAGDGPDRAGLTVSSLLMVEGDPGLVVAVVGPLTDLWDSLQMSGRFIVHLCGYEDFDLADVFAGRRPSPGGMFAAVDVEQTDWGPVISRLGDRLFCRVVGTDERGWSGVVTGEIDQVVVTDLADPLVHFRGGYRRLG